jgi:hypothetical protein
MPKFAAQTKVSVEKSRRAVEQLLEKYGAEGFGYAWARRLVAGEGGNRVEEEVAVVQFRMKGCQMRLEVPMPEARTKDATAKLHRARWRAIFLVVKAKLVAVDSGISSLEEEFLANVVMKNGQTVGEAMLHRLPEVVESGHLLPPHKE